MNDLYLRSTSVDSATESSQLLPDDDKPSKTMNADDELDLYFQMSELQNMRSNKYRRLNSYSDTDIPSGVALDSKTSVPKSSLDKKAQGEQQTLDNVVKPDKYENRPVYGQIHDTTGIEPDTVIADKQQTMMNSPVKRMNSYSDPYVKLAVGNDKVGNSFVVNDDGQDTQNNNLPQLPVCAADITNNNSGSNYISSGVSIPSSQIPLNEITNLAEDKGNKGIALVVPKTYQQQNGHVEGGYVDHGSQPSSPVKDEIDPYILMSQL